jgi:hypothetical protein
MIRACGRLSGVRGGAGQAADYAIPRRWLTPSRSRACRCRGVGVVASLKPGRAGPVAWIWLRQIVARSVSRLSKLCTGRLPSVRFAAALARATGPSLTACAQSSAWMPPGRSRGCRSCLPSGIVFHTDHGTQPAPALLSRSNTSWLPTRSSSSGHPGSHQTLRQTRRRLLQPPPGPRPRNPPPDRKTGSPRPPGHPSGPPPDPQNTRLR